MAKSDKFQRPVAVDVTEADYRAYFDSSVFRVWHLGGKVRTFKILKCGRLDSEFKGEARRQPVLEMVDRDGVVQLPFALNKTNAKTIAQLYGTKPAEWVGKLITLYPTTTDVGNETRDCIRIKNVDPSQAAASKGNARRNNQGVAVLASVKAPAREPGDDMPEDETSDDEEPPMGALSTDTDTDAEDDHAEE